MIGFENVACMPQPFLNVRHDLHVICVKTRGVKISFGNFKIEKELFLYKFCPSFLDY